MSPVIGAGRRLLLAECFGPTLQGEGPSVGQPAVFIRLSRCNLACRSCDTPYTWDWHRFDPKAESYRCAIDDLRDWVRLQAPHLVVVTGGEPLLQQDGLIPLIQSLRGIGRRVEIETNGTVAPGGELLNSVTRFNVSPKLAGFGAGMAEARRIRPEVLHDFVRSKKAVFKFVITRRSELDEVEHLRDMLELAPVWVMPAGTTRDQVLSGMSWLADEASSRNLHLSMRLHVLLWGDVRGR